LRHEADFMADNFPHILIFGCGNMGGAMLRGWLSAGVKAERFIVVDPAASNLPDGIALYRSAAEVDVEFEVVLLGIKPQMLAALAPEIAPLLAPDALLISILAGSPSTALSAHFPNARVVRLMPNLAAAIGKSPLGLFSAQTDDALHAEVEAMLSALGTPVWLAEEAHMDAVTALAGSGPAFVYRFIDALAQGGVVAGLAPDIAAKLALSMVEGAALLATGANESPAQLADRVTSPGGTTAAGLAVLDKDTALQKLIEATLCAARDRGAELAKGDTP
jgi:pyrroline-5-carboxylate reductase